MVDNALTVDAADDRGTSQFLSKADRQVLLVFGVILAVGFLILWIIQQGQPKVTIGRAEASVYAGATLRNDSLLAQLNLWRSPVDPKSGAVNHRIERANYLKALKIAQACNIPAPLLNGEPISYTRARDVDTNWYLVRIPVYPGDTFNTQWGTHCKEGRGSPRFRFRYH